jgi:hypothetical protein
MGLKCSGAYFQEQMAKIIGPQLYNGVEVYLDDVAAVGATKAEYLANLRTLLRRLKQAGVRLSPRKCRFGLREIEYVGHIINERGRTFSEAKKYKATDFPKPLLQKHMKSFLGLANYFQNHIKDHSAITAPLQAMVRSYQKGKTLAWTPETEAAFAEVKRRLGDCQFLYWMDGKFRVYLHTDASDYGVGAYLFQIDDEGNERPIRFLSQSFTDVQKRWSTIEKECYAIFFAFRQLEHLIRDRNFLLRTDH